MKKCIYLFVLSLVVSISLLSCSTNDDVPADSEQFLNADINGLLFNSSKNIANLTFEKGFNHLGTISMYVISTSDTGETLEFQINNYYGKGKYYIGDQISNKNWMSYKSVDNENLWVMGPNASLNDNRNYIEITQNTDEIIEGTISCEKMWNNLENKYGIISGTFKLSSLR